jgi:hypothetical protein
MVRYFLVKAKDGPVSSDLGICAWRKIIMNKGLTALLGGTAALIALNAAPATAATNPDSALRVQSYGELLNPIPNAVVALKVDDSRRVQPPARLQLAEHHHHHHHHHHHSSFFPGIIGAPFYAAAPESCYWTRGPAVWNGWRWVRRRIRVCD